MGQNTTIGWTHHTFNPWWGCIEVGDECDHCYARDFAKRTGHDVWNVDARRFFPANGTHWKEPLLWNTAALKAGERRRVFVGSMCDVGERMSTPLGTVLDMQREVLLWPLIEKCRGLDFLLLTKRPQNLPTVVPPAWMRDGFPPNVWVGCTAGNERGWRRVKYLRRLPAVVRFVSVEPMLGPLSDVHLTGIDWLIIGGESGNKARAFNPLHGRELVELAQGYPSAVFVKQLGARAEWIDPDSGTVRTWTADRKKDPKGEDWERWPADLADLRVRQFPRPRSNPHAPV